MPVAKIKIWTAAWVAAGALAFSPMAAKAEPKQGSASSAAKAQTVEITVTDAGFVFAQPASVKAGQPVKLVVTRKTDQTCITEILLPEYGIKQALPLNKPVEVNFTPKKAGPIQYSCGMGMSGPAFVAK